MAGRMDLCAKPEADRQCDGRAAEDHGMLTE
jgi:hypothetical protein